MIESHVTSLELSKKLKELGLKQQPITGLWWINYPLRAIIEEDGTHRITEYEWKLMNPYHYYDSHEYKKYSAFLASELGEMLPEFIENRKFIILKEISIHQSHYYTITYINPNEPILLQRQFKRFCEEKEANALAKMLIHLIENNLVTSEWREKWLEK